MSRFVQKTINGGVVVLNPNILEKGNRIFNPAFKVANQSFLNSLKSDGYNFSFDALDIPLQYERPTLVLTGKQDNSVGYRDAWALDKKMKRMTFVVLDAAGHGLPLDQSKLFKSLMDEWFDRLEHFGADMTANK
jgi:pimeloyl-ACP methyl ester carboxylesterase